MGCPHCNYTVGMQVGDGNCPSCARPLVPIGNAQPVRTGVSCGKCGTTIGLMVGSNACPSCGSPVS
jgi:rubrerythrin